MDSSGALNLPLYGFDNAGVDLPSPESWHPGTFLFRVWWNGPAVVKQHPQAGFLAHDNRRRSFRSQVELQDFVAMHVAGKTQSSPFISTSLSLFWALSLAHKISSWTQTQGQDIQITIIQATKLDPSNIYVARPNLPESHQEYNISQLRSFADQGQEVLVLHQIPQRAILCTFYFDTYVFRCTCCDDEEVRWSSLFPWISFHDDSWTAKDHAESWINLFTDPDVKQARTEHGARSILWAMEQLDAVDDDELREEVLALAIYVYRWPSSRRPAHARPSWETSAALIRRRWNALRR